MFFRDLEPVKGRVLACKVARTYGGGSVGPLLRQHEYVVEYQADDGEAKRVSLKEKVGKMVSPAVGASVPLLVDRKTGEVHWDIKNPQLNLSASLKAHKAAEQAEFDKFKP